MRGHVEELGGVFLHEARVHAISNHVGMLEQCPQKSDVGRHSIGTKLGQSAAGPSNDGSVVPRRLRDDDFREQRIEPRARGVPTVSERIDPNARSRRNLEYPEPASRGPGCVSR